MPKRLAIIDYGLGNLHSVAKSMQLAAPNWQVMLCNQPEQIAQADKLIFPGVGAIGDCLSGLDRLKLTQALIKAVEKRWCLAICVGFQAMFSRMFESGDQAGLNLISGEIRHLDELARQQQINLATANLRVPHSGWNQLKINSNYIDHPFFTNIPMDSWVYFVHSYGLAATGQSFVAATADHGIELAAIAIKDKLIGCQFHPEKSHASGQRLLSNFILL